MRKGGQDAREECAQDSGSFAATGPQDTSLVGPCLRHALLSAVASIREIAQLGAGGIFVESRRWRRADSISYARHGVACTTGFLLVLNSTCLWYCASVADSASEKERTLLKGEKRRRIDGETLLASVTVKRVRTKEGVIELGGNFAVLAHWEIPSSLTSASC